MIKLYTIRIKFLMFHQKMKIPPTFLGETLLKIRLIPPLNHLVISFTIILVNSMQIPKAII